MCPPLARLEKLEKAVYEMAGVERVLDGNSGKVRCQNRTLSHGNPYSSSYCIVQNPLQPHASVVTSMLCKTCWPSSVAMAGILVCVNWMHAPGAVETCVYNSCRHGNHSAPGMFSVMQVILMNEEDVRVWLMARLIVAIVGFIAAMDAYAMDATLRQSSSSLTQNWPGDRRLPCKMPVAMLRDDLGMLSSLFGRI